MECSICGVSELTRPIFRALSPTGIVLVCENCAQEQGYPLVKKPGMKKEDFEKKDTVYETMVRLSGVKGREQPEIFHPSGREIRAKEVIAKNYEMKTQQAVSLAPRPDLVDNFHWIIMRVRRVKGLTQGQLAERINESENSIKMAEQGIIPSGYDLPNKLERFLGVRIIKDKIMSAESGFPKTERNLNNSNIVPVNQSKQPARIIPEPKKQEPQKVVYPKSGIISFDKKILDHLTIDDLKRIKMEKERVQKTLVDLEKDNNISEEDSTYK